MMKHFIRFDPQTGQIVSYGFMEEKHIENLIQSGQSLMIVDEPLDINLFKVNLDTGKIEYIKVDYDAEMQTKFIEIKNFLNVMVISELSRTDYTQANDAIDHMSQENIDAYKIYRATLRNVVNAPTLYDSMLILPETDPKGNPVFQEFKERFNT